MRPTSETTPEDLEEYYHAYFGPDADYYMEKLEQRQAGTRFTFNIGAFFLGLLWLFYRKMYLVALLVMAVVTGESLLTSYLIKTLPLSEPVALFLNLGGNVLWSLLLGFGGNWLYLKQADWQVNRVLAKEPTEEQAIYRLQRVGSVTFIPHIILAAIILLSLLLGNQLPI
ncbi:MAG: DUF2628 domain-containing protein [Rufibacter sp.]